MENKEKLNKLNKGLFNGNNLKKAFAIGTMAVGLTAMSCDVSNPFIEKIIEEENKEQQTEQAQNSNFVSQEIGL